MAVELGKTYHQTDLPNSDFFAEISKSHWTEFAEANNIKISIEPLVHRKPRSSGSGTKNMFHSRRHFVDGSTWDEYLNKLPFYEVTIQDYKNAHEQKRPIWARTFAERGGSVIGKYKILGSDKNENNRFWAVEPEDFWTQKGVVKVLRYTDGGGSCRRVIIVSPPNNEGYYYIRQEDWVSRSKWVVSLESSLTKDNVDKLIPS